MVRSMGLLFTSKYSLVSSAASHKVRVWHSGFLHMAGPVQLQCKALRCWTFGLLLRVAALPPDCQILTTLMEQIPCSKMRESMRRHGLYPAKQKGR